VRWTFVGVLGVAAVLGIAAGFEYDAASDVTVYRSAWSLRYIADDGTSIRIAVAEGCGGEDRFDHAEFRELDAALEVTVFNRVPTHEDCTDEGGSDATTFACRGRSATTGSSPAAGRGATRPAVTASRNASDGSRFVTDCY